MNLVFIVCPNGLGHFKRCQEVIKNITNKKNIEVTVICERWQIFAYNKSHRTVRADCKVRQRFDVMEPGVKLQKDGKLQDGFSWEEKLREISDVHTADLVISDNLPGVLSIRPDAILMGSFLWSEVLAKQPNLAAVTEDYIRHELALLSVHQPQMLCLNDMAMPAVIARTRAVRLPWFCERVGKSDGRPQNIIVSGGLTGLLGKVLRRVAWSLDRIQGLEISVTTQLFESLPQHNNIQNFCFSNDAFQRAGMLVCRPGIGSLTDAVRFGLPVVALVEPDNQEMVHNAKRVTDLGIGLSLDCNTDPDEIAQIIFEFTKSSNYKKAKNRISNVEVGGAKAAAKWMFDQLS